MRLLQFCGPGLLYILHSTVLGCFVRNIKDLCKTVRSIPFPDSSWLKSIHSSYWQLQTKTNHQEERRRDLHIIVSWIEISRGMFFSPHLSCPFLLTTKTRNCVPLISLRERQTDFKSHSYINIHFLFRVFLSSGSVCVQQNHFSLSRNKCLELINQAKKSPTENHFPMISQCFEQARPAPLIWALKSQSMLINL